MHKKMPWFFLDIKKWIGCIPDWANNFSIFSMKIGETILQQWSPQKTIIANQILVVNENGGIILSWSLNLHHHHSIMMIYCCCQHNNNIIIWWWRWHHIIILILWWQYHNNIIIQHDWPSWYQYYNMMATTPSFYNINIMTTIS